MESNDWDIHNAGGKLGSDKPIIKTETVEIDVAYCPKCQTKLEELTEADHRAVATYRCPKCKYVN
jgi:ssDNA-binding Zn-finger/Zn-ribbon topoisomerase 1